MSVSTKYGRTYHYPFSPGTTSDDRINSNYIEDLSKINTVIHTEKLDGENNCLSRYGIFARSHATPTTSPWTRSLKAKWDVLKHDLGDYEIFGENLYAIHSIKYVKLKEHYFVFGIREHGRWLSWEETEFISAFFDFPTVPVLETISINSEKYHTDDWSDFYRKNILIQCCKRSEFESIDALTNNECTIEGIVTRNIEGYDASDFQHNVFKYVRKGHVKTDEHWTRNWKRAPLIHENHVDH